MGFVPGRDHEEHALHTTFGALLGVRCQILQLKKADTPLGRACILFENEKIKYKGISPFKFCMLLRRIIGRFLQVDEDLAEASPPIFQWEEDSDSQSGMATQPCQRWQPMFVIVSY